MSASEATFLRQLLGAHDASGERLLGRVQVLAIPCYVASASLAPAAGVAGVLRWVTTVSFGIYACAVLALAMRGTPHRPGLSYATTLLDLGHAFAFGLALLLGSGPSALDGATALWVGIAVINGASVIRGDPRVCLFAFASSLGLSAWLNLLGGAWAGLTIAASARVFVTHGVLAALPALVAAIGARRERELVQTAARAQQKRDEERVRLEWRLKVADRMVTVGTMAAGVAHEMNNPLTYVLGNVDWAVSHLSARDDLLDVREVLVHALEGAVRVQSIVAALRTFSRVEEGPLVAVDVQKNVAAALTMASSELRHRARTEVNIPRGLSVIANEGKLGQVFLNLIVNAAQAIPEGEHARHSVRIRGFSRGGKVAVEVTDTGVGIEPSHAARIFDPFFTTKPVGAGTGLGLSICQSIVTELGGRIEVESAPGKGSTFRVWLVESELGPPSRSSITPSNPGERGSVLVVDDDRLVAQSLALILADDHDVVTVSSATEALKRVTDGQSFDAIICDLMMPGMGGIELFYELEVLAPELARHMLFATGGAFTSAAQSFVEKMHTRVVAKPFRGDDLRRKVTRTVHHARTSSSAQSARADSPLP